MTTTRTADPTPGSGGAGRVLVAWNPEAGSKAGLPTNRNSGDALRAALAEAGLGDDVLELGADGEADQERLRAAVADGVDVIVAAGGDGTAGLVANATLGSSTALGILPLGSAMNLARSLGIPRDLRAAAQIVATGRTTEIDVGRSAAGRFFEMASVGINAAVLGEAHRLAEGDYHSIVDLFRAVVAYRPATMRIRLDDETVETGALMAVVANTPYTGAGLTLAPDARLDDGLFDVAVYRHFSKWELARYALSILAGRRQYSPKVRTFRSRRVRIEGHRALPARVDDRDLGATPIEVELIPRALRVIVGPSYGRELHGQAAPSASD